MRSEEQQLPPSMSEPREEAGPAPYRPIGILRWFYQRFFSHIHVDATWKQAVLGAAERGTVVYVMRSLSLLDFLCLDFLLKRFALPLVRFVNDFGLWILEPFKGGRRCVMRRQVPEEVALSEAVRGGYSALLFLRRPPPLARRLRNRRGEAFEADLLLQLIQVQRRQDRSILLVPQTFVWSKRPNRAQATFTDLLFGPTEWPGRLRVLFQFLFNYRNALLRAGEPFDLKSFVDRHAHLSDADVAQKVRYALLKRLERERTLVLGPTKKSPQRIRDELLRSHRVAKHIETTARTQRKTVDQVKKEAAAELQRLCAAPSPMVVGFMHRFLRWLLHRMYQAVVVDTEGMERVRLAGREGTLVLIPSHKSHMDYLVLSEVMYAHALSPPLIAAGDNLNFWPVGGLLRRGGAFFIRRAFRGRKLYSALVEAYIRKLIAEGFSIEFFFEGGRSRTGKLLPPKLGLLSMIVDAAMLVRTRPIFIVPVYIGYERVVEERSHLREVEGGEKRKESLAGLLRAPKVVKSKHGKLYVQFGTILSLDNLVKEAAECRPATSSCKKPHAPDSEGSRPRLTPSQKRSLVQKTAREVGYLINRVAVATPSSIAATALLGHRRRGSSQSTFFEACRFLHKELIKVGAEVASSLTDEEGELALAPILESLNLFAQGKVLQIHESQEQPIYVVSEEKRLTLEFYKNNILHFFVPKAIVATSVYATASRASSYALVAEHATRLSELLRQEFTFSTRATFTATFEAQLDQLLAEHYLVETDDVLFPAGGEKGRELRWYSYMLRPYLEAYRLALLSLKGQADKELGTRDWTRKALAFGRRMYLLGEIECREALARPKLDNALIAFRDLGLVDISQAGKTSKFRVLESSKWEETSAELDAYLHV